SAERFESGFVSGPRRTRRGPFLLQWHEMTRDHRGKWVAVRKGQGVSWGDWLLYAWALATVAALLVRWLSPTLDYKAANAILAVQSVGLLAYAAARPQQQVRRLVRTRLSVRQCPTCCYDLTGLLPADDGCTVCP